MFVSKLVITSLQNQYVKVARALQRRRRRDREGKLLLEGVRLVGDAIDAGAIPDFLFYTEGVLQDEAAATVVEQVNGAAFCVSDEVIASVADTVTPQGLAGVFPQPALPWPSASTLLLVCDSVRDPGNLGTLVRAAAGAGVEGIVLPRGNVDVWNPKVLRAGMGAHFRIPIRTALAWDEVPPLVEGCSVRLADAAGDVRYFDADWCVPSALIIGGEAHGAGRAAARLAQKTVSIPLSREVESLNAAMAGSIILFEARRQRLTTQ